MSDDIVTRLRIACRQEGAEYCGECQPCQVADEIERLRADRDKWLNIAFCTHCLPQHDHYCSEHGQDEDGRLPDE